MTTSISQVNPINLGSASPALTIPAIKYISGDREWYAMTIPYRVLGKFIQTSAVKKKNQEIIKSELKNRFLDPKHKNEIKEYIKEEREFTIPPITLVSYDKLDFRPFTFGDNLSEISIDSTGSVSGVIVLPIDYEFECLDGNHRTVAIRELAAENPELIADSSILLNVVYEERQRKIRQDFVDVNRNAKQTTSSINTLFNTREKLSGLVVDTIERFSYLKETTELLATTVSKNSKDIYTINNIRNAVIEIAGYNSQGASNAEKKISEMLKENEEYARDLGERIFLFFDALSQNSFIHECMQNREKTPEVRNEALLTSGTGLIIASRLYGQALKREEATNQDWVNRKLRGIVNYNWSRRNTDFVGNVITGDHKISNSRDSIAAAYEIISRDLGI